MSSSSLRALHPIKFKLLYIFFSFVYCTEGFYCRHIASHPYGISQSGNHIPTCPNRAPGQWLQRRTFCFILIFFFLFVLVFPLLPALTGRPWVVDKARNPFGTPQATAPCPGSILCPAHHQTHGNTCPPLRLLPQHEFSNTDSSPGETLIFYLSYQVHPFKLLSKTFFIIFSLSSQELMVSEFPG